jgi:hypothetical protein
MTPTVVGSGAGVAGSVIRSPSTAIRRAARCASNISRETPAAKKRSSTVTTSAPRSTPPMPPAPVLAEVLTSGVRAGSRSATPAVSPATPTRSARHRVVRRVDHPYRRHDPPEIGRPTPCVPGIAHHCSAAGLRRRGGGTPVRDHCSIHSTSTGGGGGGGVSANCASSVASTRGGSGAGSSSRWGSGSGFAVVMHE